MVRILIGRGILGGNVGVGSDASIDINPLIVGVHAVTIEMPDGAALDGVSASLNGTALDVDGVGLNYECVTTAAGDLIVTIDWTDAQGYARRSRAMRRIVEMALLAPDEWLAREATDDADTRKTVVETVPMAMIPGKTLFAYRGPTLPAAGDYSGFVAMAYGVDRYTWKSTGQAGEAQTIYARVAIADDASKTNIRLFAADDDVKSFVASGRPLAPAFDYTPDGSGAVQIILGTINWVRRVGTTGEYRVGTGSWTTFPVSTPPRITGLTDGVPTNVTIRLINANGPGAPATKSVTSEAPAGADYIVTNNAEWNTVVANPAENLSGKVIEIRGTGFTDPLVISGKAVAQPITVRGDGTAVIPQIAFNNVPRWKAKGFRIQWPGWGSDIGSLFKGRGAIVDAEIDGVTFRQGYGEDHEDFDLTTPGGVPHLAWQDHFVTATTTSTRYPITWVSPGLTGGQMRFRNNGTEAVYVMTGDNTVVADTSGTRVEAGGIALRYLGASTHFAVMSVSGTVPMNAQAGKGLGGQMVDTFDMISATTIENLTISNCLFTDLYNGIKGVKSPSGKIVIRNNEMRRVYQDLISLGIEDSAPNAQYWIVGNYGQAPFVAEGPILGNGDPGDPHGDIIQIFGGNDKANLSDQRGGVHIIGNLIWPSPREGSTAQGVFLTDNFYNNENGGYYNAVVVGNAFENGGKAFSIGASLGTYMDGNVFITKSGPGNKTNQLYPEAGYNNMIRRMINPGRISSAALPLTKIEQWQLFTNTAQFPNWGNLMSANTKTGYLAVLAQGGQCLGRGYLL